jgi:hypothetical protein
LSNRRPVFANVIFGEERGGLGESGILRGEHLAAIYDLYVARKQGEGTSEAARWRGVCTREPGLCLPRVMVPACAVLCGIIASGGVAHRVRSCRGKGFRGPTFVVRTDFGR